MRISDWSSDVCSSDLLDDGDGHAAAARLAQVGGTRLLTDALHLAELLQARTESGQGLHAQLRWFAQQCAAPSQGDDLALRLDDDADAVQVMTLHKAKGLEYPVVFLPFTAFADNGGSSGGLRRSRVRDDDGAAANYFHLHSGSGKAKEMVLGDPARHAARPGQENDRECAKERRLQNGKAAG